MLDLTPQSLAGDVDRLFSLPDIALRINECLSDPRTTHEDLAEIIQNDPTLTGQLLKLVNSSLYNYPNKIDTLSRAISILGLNELRMLVLAVSVSDTFPDIPDSLVDMNTFWYHSVTSAVIARLLALHYQKKDSERFFIAGLLHSIGKLMFFTRYPKQAAKILRTTEHDPKAVQQAEHAVFGFTYAEAGAALLKKWQLPESIWKIIAYQLNPLQAQDWMDDTCLLSIATDIADHIEPCAKIDVDFEEPELDFSQPAYQHLGLQPEQASDIIQEAIFESFEILSFIRPEAAQIF